MAKTKEAPGELTTKDLMKGFGVGHMTIYNWRHGTPTKTPLPHHVDAQRHVTFAAEKITAWAKEHDLTFKLSAVKKAGPKKPLKAAAGKPARSDAAALAHVEAKAAAAPKKNRPRSAAHVAALVKTSEAATKTERIPSTQPATSNKPKAAKPKPAPATEAVPA